MTLTISTTNTVPQQPNVLTFIWVGLGFSAAESLSWVAIDCGLTWLSGKKTLDKGNKTVDNASIRLAHSALWVLAAIGLSALQYLRWVPQLNMAPHLHFNNYASAVLDPLPRDAVLLINYVSEIRTLPPSTIHHLYSTYSTSSTSISLPIPYNCEINDNYIDGDIMMVLMMNMMVVVMMIIVMIMMMIIVMMMMMMIIVMIMMMIIVMMMMMMIIVMTVMMMMTMCRTSNGPLFATCRSARASAVTSLPSSCP